MEKKAIVGAYNITANESGVSVIKDNTEIFEYVNECLEPDDYYDNLRVYDKAIDSARRWGDSQRTVVANLNLYVTEANDFNRINLGIPDDIERFIWYVSEIGGDSKLLDELSTIELTEKDYKILRNFRESLADIMEIEDDTITHETMMIIQQVEDFIHERMH